MSLALLAGLLNREALQSGKVTPMCRGATERDSKQKAAPISSRPAPLPSGRSLSPAYAVGSMANNARFRGDPASEETEIVTGVLPRRLVT